MTHTEFCYWLQGFIELANPKTLNTEQVKMIKDHLQLCFNPVTKNFGMGIIDQKTPFLKPSFSISDGVVNTPNNGKLCNQSYDMGGSIDNYNPILSYAGVYASC